MATPFLIGMIVLPAAAAVGAIIEQRFGLTTFLIGCALANVGGLMMAKGL